MRASAILFEALSNIRSGMARATLWCAVIVLVMGVAVIADVVTVRGVFVDQRDFVASGGATTIIESQGKIDKDRCISLSKVAGVRGSFAAIVQTDGAESGLDVLTLPGTKIRVREVTGDYLTTLGGQGNANYGVGIPSAYGHKLGLDFIGAPLPLESATAHVSSVFSYPNDGRDERYAATFFMPSTSAAASATATSTASATASATPTATSTAFDECVFTVWPANAEIESLGLTVLAPGTELQDVKVTQLNASKGASQETKTLLQSRQSLYIPLAAALLASVVGAVSVRVRKLELALGLSLGVRKSAQMTQALLETLCWLVPGAILVVAASLLIGTDSLTAVETQFVVRLTLSRTLGLSAAVVLGVILSLAAISPRRVYDWFKDR